MAEKGVGDQAMEGEGVEARRIREREEEEVRSKLASRRSLRSQEEDEGRRLVQRREFAVEGIEEGREQSRDLRTTKERVWGWPGRAGDDGRAAGRQSRHRLCPLFFSG